MGEIAICTKPLARRTLPRVRGSAVMEAWEIDKLGH